MAAYIYALESAGARTVPLIFDSEDSESEFQKIDKLNGILFCGGAAIDDDYESFGRAVYNKVKALND